MHALAVLKKENDAGIIFGQDNPGEFVHSGFSYVAGSPRKVNCEQMINTLANHMAHSRIDASVQDGSYPLEIKNDDPHGTRRRAEASKVFLGDIRAQCS